jgi:hypothetical protein
MGRTRRHGDGHEFTLVLTDPIDLTDDLTDALSEAGCDDGTPCLRGGIAYVVFTRHAPSLKDAIVSAIHDVREANQGTDVLRVEGPVSWAQ